MPDSILWKAVFSGILASLACGLGVLPLLFKKIDSEKQVGIGYAFAGGLMFSASVYNLILPGLQMHSSHIPVNLALKVIVGILVGTLFISMVEKFLEGHNLAFTEKLGGKKITLIFIAMCIHSIPEGVAVGVGYTSGEIYSSNLGEYIALAIGIHNIPEGLAVAIPMHFAGISLKRCFIMAILTSIPQPLASIPAVYLSWFFQPLMPVLMGFAAGAMIFLVILEMIPNALKQESPNKIAWVFIYGFCCMILLQVVL